MFVFTAGIGCTLYNQGSVLAQYPLANEIQKQTRGQHPSAEKHFQAILLTSLCIAIGIQAG